MPFIFDEIGLVPVRIGNEGLVHNFILKDEPGIMWLLFANFVLKYTEMETLTIRINTRTDKGKQLFGLINELAKEGTVKIQNIETYKEVKTSIKEMRAGKIKPIEDLFK